MADNGFRLFPLPRVRICRLKEEQFKRIGISAFYEDDRFFKGYGFLGGK